MYLKKKTIKLDHPNLQVAPKRHNDRKQTKFAQKFSQRKNRYSSMIKKK